MPRRTDSPETGRYSIFLIFALICGTLISVSACRLLLENDEVIGTLVAVKVQQTQLAGTSLALGTPGTYATSILIPSPPQLQLSAILGGSALETLMPQSQAEVPNFERRKKAAKILLFENMSASGQVRYVKEALDGGGYFYLDVGSATGWFRNQLLSSQEWDLIIAAAEARRDFGGEFFELINQHLEAGEAAIVEHWDIDLAPNGKVDRLLENCGVDFDSDWYEPEMRVFFWLVPDHPIFNIPNKIPPLTDAQRFWKGDIGDLLEIRYRNGLPEGDAVLLAVTNPALKNQHATLVNCYHQRLILQTFSSHEYSNFDVIHLWQNYIDYTLRARFAGQPSTIPTALNEIQPTGSFVMTPANSAGTTPENLKSCDGVLSGKLTRPVRFQHQLFEHNAAGEFLTVEFNLENTSQTPIQIWDDDYRVEGNLFGIPVQYPIQKAATGYLFNENSMNLWQDLIQPKTSWETSLAFDVDPRGEDWVLLITPGLEVNEQSCQLRISLTQ